WEPHLGGPVSPPAAAGRGGGGGAGGGGRLLLAAGREQLAAVLRPYLPGALRAGVPVQTLRKDRLLLLGPLCQFDLPLRPGLGGRPVPALPGQVQVNIPSWLFNYQLWCGSIT
uniref:Uncharacterized protein n=1 Tax=Capra hircus TaxID=9925 RepID=A0A452DKK7_CAPHI